MTMDQLRYEDRLSGTLIVSATIGAAVLMMHHPSSLTPGDDGRLLADWTNRTVHGGMIACLLINMFAFTIVARRLHFNALSARAGGMAFTAGMAAFVIAGLITGFVISGLQVALPDTSEAAMLQFRSLWIFGQVFALFGVAMIGSAAVLWTKPMLALGGTGRIVAVLGIILAISAFGWLLAGSGRLDLNAASFGAMIFALWALGIAALLLNGKIRS